jgi:hypothetical protein
MAPRLAVARKAIARRHAHAAQRSGDFGGLFRQFGPTQRLQRLSLGLIPEGRLSRTLVAKEILGVVEAGAGKPARLRHGSFAQDGCVGRRGDHREVVPQAGPKVFELCHRPMPELGIAGKVQSFGGPQPGQVVGKVGLFDLFV